MLVPRFPCGLDEADHLAGSALEGLEESLRSPPGLGGGCKEIGRESAPGSMNFVIVWSVLVENSLDIFCSGKEILVSV